MRPAWAPSRRRAADLGGRRRGRPRAGGRQTSAAVDVGALAPAGGAPEWRPWARAEWPPALRDGRQARAARAGPWRPAGGRRAADYIRVGAPPAAAAAPPAERHTKCKTIHVGGAAATRARGRLAIGGRGGGSGPFSGGGGGGRMCSPCRLRRAHGRIRPIEGSHKRPVMGRLVTHCR